MAGIPERLPPSIAKSGLSRTTPLRTFAVFAAALVLGAAAALAAEPAPRPFETIQYPPLHPIHEPPVVRRSLPNGLKLILVEDHELPIVTVRALVRGGRLAEPPGKAGLTELLGESLRAGGLQNKTGDQVDEILERIGASIEAGASDASVTVTAKMLAENADQVLPLFAGYLQSPAFAQEKLDLAKTHQRSAISRRNDEPMAIARREFLKRVYGPRSPYARQIEYADVDGITRDDLLAYHGRVFRPDATVLAVWGDFNAGEMRARLAKALGGWKAPAGAPSAWAPAPVPTPVASVNYAEKRDVEQTTVLMGHAGLRLDDPDYPAVNVLSEILGGGMSSRIFAQVRTIKGLAYGAGGYMVPAYDHPGAFSFYTATKPGSTAEAVRTMLDEIERIRKEPVTDEELRKAKEGYLNGYAFEFDSTEKIVSRLQVYELYGYPPDFNVRLRNAIEKVTKEDVLRAARRHLRPGQLALVAVGDASRFDKPLSAFGAVEAVDLTIPEPTAPAGK